MASGRFWDRRKATHEGTAGGVRRGRAGQTHGGADGGGGLGEDGDEAVGSENGPDGLPDGAIAVIGDGLGGLNGDVGRGRGVGGAGQRRAGRDCEGVGWRR